MKILAIIHGSKSHLNACRSILKQLDEAKFEIAICSSKVIEKELSAMKYSYYLVNIMPFGSGFETFLTKGKKNGYFKDVQGRLNDVIYKTRKSKLNKVLYQAKPDIILLDILYASDVMLIFPFLERYQKHLLYFSTMPSLDRTIYNPPLNSYVIPESRKQIDSLWVKYNNKKRIKRYIDYFRCLFHDDISILRNKANGVDKKCNDKYPLVLRNLVGLRLENIPQLVLVPREYEFGSFKPNIHQHYVGFQFFKRQETIENFTDYNVIRSLIITSKKNGKRIVYCSFGSLYSKFEVEVKGAIKEIVKAAKNLVDCLFIISFKNKIQEQLIKTQTPKNILFFDFVPQLLVLSLADLFITHGGLNSIKEAIHNTVPMLVYPLNENWDQPGNSARIVFHGLGLRGKVREINSETLIMQIEEIFDKLPSFKRSLRLMKNHDLSYDSEMFLETFHKLIRTSPI